MNTAVIVNTYNHLSGLESCLLSLQRQTCPANRIYIADDGSGPETRALVDRFRELLPLQHVWHEDIGFRRSRIMNLAISDVSEPYVIFVDGDEVLHHRFVEDHCQAASAGSVILGTRCGLLGWRQRVMSQEPTVVQVMRHYFSGRLINDSRAIEITFKTRLVGLSKAFRLPRPKVRSAPDSSTRGGNMAAWLADLLRVNGFDSEYEGWGFEDHDLVRRLRGSGVGVKQVVGGAICFHLEADQGKVRNLNEARFKQVRPVICRSGIREFSQ